MTRRLTLSVVLLALAAPAHATAATISGSATFAPTRTTTESVQTLSFFAEGGAELMGNAAVVGDPAFAVAQDSCSGEVITEVCLVQVRFAPLDAGPHNATLRLSGSRGDAVVALSGIGYTIGSQLSRSVELMDFGMVGRGTLSAPMRVTLTAGGDLSTVIAGVMFDGPARDDFVLTADGCTRATLAPGASCTIEVRANPSRYGIARLRVVTDPPEAEVTVGLTVVPPPMPNVSPEDPPWSLGITGVQAVPRGVVVRVYSSLPAIVTVTVQRGRRVVRRARTRILPGVDKVLVRRRLRSGRYRIRVAASRLAARRSDSVRLRVR